MPLPSARIRPCEWMFLLKMVPVLPRSCEIQQEMDGLTVVMVGRVSGGCGARPLPAACCREEEQPRAMRGVSSVGCEMEPFTDVTLKRRLCPARNESKTIKHLAHTHRLLLDVIISAIEPLQKNLAQRKVIPFSNQLHRLTYGR